MLNGSLLSLHNLKSAINLDPPGRIWLRCWCRKTNYIPLTWQKCVTSTSYNLTWQTNRYFCFPLHFLNSTYLLILQIHIYLTTQRLFPSSKDMFILLNWETFPSSFVQVYNLSLLKLRIRRGEEGGNMSSVFSMHERSHTCAHLCTPAENGFHRMKPCKVTARSSRVLWTGGQPAAAGGLSLKLFVWPQISTYIFSVVCSELEL